MTTLHKVLSKKKETALRVAMVGYYNTLPFLYGLRKDDFFELILDIPSRCMEYYGSGEADIALVPVATLLDRSDYEIVTDYCIGCQGSVRTVCVFSNRELHQISKIYLDQDSRTSQLLTKIVCNRLWDIQPEFVECDARNFKSENLLPNEAILMIGDKVFDKEEAFANRYDLGTEWYKMTNLPFAFAVWIARKNVDAPIIKRLNAALRLGVDNIERVLQQNASLATKIELSEYFNEFIDFHFDDQKQKALLQFFDLSKKVAEEVTS